MTVFERLHIIRKELRISQQEMAKRLGYKNSSGYSMLESGQVRVIPKAKLIVLKEMMGINLEWLMTGEGERFINDNSNIESFNSNNYNMNDYLSKINQLIEQNNVLVKQVSDLIKMQLLNAETIHNLSSRNVKHQNRELNTG